MVKSVVEIDCMLVQQAPVAGMTLGLPTGKEKLQNSQTGAEVVENLTEKTRKHLLGTGKSEYLQFLFLTQFIIS